MQSDRFSVYRISSVMTDAVLDLHYMLLLFETLFLTFELFENCC